MIMLYYLCYLPFIDIVQHFGQSKLCLNVLYKLNLLTYLLPCLPLYCPLPCNSFYNTKSVVLCLGITGVVCLLVTIFSFQTKVSHILKYTTTMLCVPVHHG